MTYTPWGPSQTEREAAPGIVFYSTASHGGFRLSPEREKQLQSKFCFRTWAGGPWYEEDCDALCIDLAFGLEIDRPEGVYHAVKYARSATKYGDQRFEDAVRFLDSTEEGRRVQAMADQYAASVAGQWQRSGASSMVPKHYPSTVWNVTFHRGEDWRSVLMPYPEKTFYTDAELDALHIDLPERAPIKSTRSTVPAFKESECGGVFDGFSVSSDADPGI